MDDDHDFGNLITPPLLRLQRLLLALIQLLLLLCTATLRTLFMALGADTRTAVR